jgi:hypothetical protein
VPSVIKEIVNEYNLKGSKVYTAFLDLSKAFDKVNHSILLPELADSNVSPNIINILKHMYDNQFINVSFNGITGEEWKLGNGTRQGGITSPLLFNFYINCVLEDISKMNVGCKFVCVRHNGQSYADDLTLLSPSAKGLQMLIDKVYNMLQSLCLSLNDKKSVCMIFDVKKNKNFSPPNFFLNGVKMNIVNSYKYLGIILRNDLNNNDDISRCESTFNGQFYSFFRKVHYCSQDVLLFLFQSYCSSLYGSPLWDQMYGAENEIKSFSVNYHKAVKRIARVPNRYSNHDICDQTGLLLFKHLLNFRMVSYLFQIRNSKSECLTPYIHHLTHYSSMAVNVKNIFANLYGISDIFDNDIEAIYSRINFVQQREERSTYYLNNINS